MRFSTVVLLLFLCGCATPDPGGEASADAGQTNLADAGDSQPDVGARGDWVEEIGDSVFETALTEAAASADSPGLAIGVAEFGSKVVRTGAAGLASKEPSQPWEASSYSRIGSVTKTFTAAVVYQLFDEGVWSLDDRLEDWVPGFYDGKGVQIRHLMTNTSGIVSYNYVGSFDDTKPWTPTELVEWAVTHEPELRFEPGTEWEYSNTNWVLLGLAIEAATGRTYEEAVEQRLLLPLGLRDTYVASSPGDDDPVVHCYDASGADTTERVDPSFGWAAGAMVSTPRDLAIWGAELFEGDIISAESRALMTRPLVLQDGTTVEYGMGAFVETDGVDALYGHTGGIGGYLTYMYHWRADGVTLVVMVNQEEVDLRAAAGAAWTRILGL